MTASRQILKQRLLEFSATAFPDKLAKASASEDVIKKAFDRCNKYLKQKPKKYPKDSICILYYKGTTPTTDQEKIETAKKYYSQVEVERFFEKYPYVLNDSTNSLLKKSKITKKITQSDNDIVSKLKNLKELLDSGVLTKEESEKAKKKLLN